MLILVTNVILEGRKKSECSANKSRTYIYMAQLHMHLDCEQSLFCHSRLGSAGLESESRGETGEKAGKEGGTAVTDAFKFLRGPSIGELDWLINNRMLSVRCHCNL